MKKIAILTINDYNNYGNRLQNYATQEVIKSFGFSVETIVHEIIKPNASKNSKVNSKIMMLKNMSTRDAFLKVMSKISNRIIRRKQQEYKLKRYQSFKNFTNNFINETNYAINELNIPGDLSERYDYFITGSDQVWNPTFRFGSPIDFLTFAPKHKRIALSPSFGIGA